MTIWRLCQSHLAIICINVPSVDVAVAVTVDNLVAIDKYQMRSLRLLYTLRQGVLLLTKGHLLVIQSLATLTTTHGCAHRVFEVRLVRSRKGAT